MVRAITRTSNAFWIVTAYFNWSHFKTKRSNYEIFRARLEECGLRIVTVECALHGEPFELTGLPNVVQVRTRSIMWQKERLINIALEYLPHECRFVAWLDCDLLFMNPKWSTEATSLLESFAVVQLFDRMSRLPPGRLEISSEEEPTLSFMGGLRKSSEKEISPRLGHPGFAWAARRDVLEACGGLYDTCIIGGADRVMAHAWFGDYHAQIVRDIAIGNISPHYQLWAERAHRVVRGSVSLVEGVILHLWHGESSNRHYFDRHSVVETLKFDPSVDLAMNADGCWEWASGREELGMWMKSYFDGRREDG